MLRRAAASARGWLYCGSHNMSGSAWGSRVARSGALRVGLYELGVLLLDVAPAEYDLPFDYEAPRVYDAEADLPGGGYSNAALLGALRAGGVLLSSD